MGSGSKDTNIIAIVSPISPNVSEWLSVLFVDTKWKVNLSIELKASMAIEFDLGHDIETWGVRISQVVTGMTSDV